MATAEQALTAEEPLPQTPFSRVVEIFNRLPTPHKVGLMVAVASVIALLVGGWLWVKEVPYGVVFSNLSEQDGGQIVATLQQQNIPYRISDNGSAILVPAGQVHDVRLRLATQGLPKGGLVGFEVMETQKLGISQFAEQINYQRALEGELARSIQSLAAVKSARVHLAIPKQTAFLRDEEKPSASVLLTLRYGQVLNNSQITGIIHLVSSSVPKLTLPQISVVDQEGNLLSKQFDAPKSPGLDARQIKYMREIEQDYIKRIEDILTPVVGSANVRAQVTVDIDFSQSEQVAEIYRPNPATESAIRSQQSTESGDIKPAVGGVPGALTNQPPVPATAPITTPAVPAAAGTAGPNYSKSATINYEVDKTVRHTRTQPAVIKRVSAAVVVNQRQGPEDKKTGKFQTVPRTEAEMKKMTSLVQETVGYSKERGDTVSVADVSFVPPEKEVVPDIPIWKDPDAIALAREAGKWMAYALLVLLVWLKVFKPLLAPFAAEQAKAEEAAKAAEEAAKAEEAAAEEAAKAEEEAKTEEAAKAEEEAKAEAEEELSPYVIKLRQVHDLARQDPKLVANIIKEWIGGGEPR